MGCVEARAALRAALPGASDDFEVTLPLPVGDAVLPLTPLPLAGGGEVIDEEITEPVARKVRAAEDLGRLPQRARRARDVFSALVGAGDRRCGELQVLLDPVQPGREQRRHRQVRIDV